MGGARAREKECSGAGAAAQVHCRGWGGGGPEMVHCGVFAWVGGRRVRDRPARSPAHGCLAENVVKAQRQLPASCLGLCVDPCDRRRMCAWTATGSFLVLSLGAGLEVGGLCLEPPRVPARAKREFRWVAHSTLHHHGLAHAMCSPADRRSMSSSTRRVAGRRCRARSPAATTSCSSSSATRWVCVVGRGGAALDLRGGTPPTPGLGMPGDGGGLLQRSRSDDLLAKDAPLLRWATQGPATLFSNSAAPSPTTAPVLRRRKPPSRRSSCLT